MSDNTSKIEAQRSSNFEILRILLILFVIVLHYNNPERHGTFYYVESMSMINKIFLYTVHSFTLCAVDAFFCLSGFFLSKKNEVSTSKIVHLFTIFIAYRILTYLPVALFRHTFSISDFFLLFYSR